MSKKIEPLSNFDIMEELRPIKKFRGVFSRDNTPFLNNNESLVMNLDDKNGNGTHWTAMIKKGNKILYFDSYGYPPSQEIVNMYKNKSKILYSSNNIQHNDSIMCGFFCVQFIEEVSNGKSFYDFLYQYDIKPTVRNEMIIRKYFNLL